MSFSPSVTAPELIDVTQMARNSRARKVASAPERDVEVGTREDLASLVHWRLGTKLPIHRWFRYREGFSPDLISALGLGASLLDPFCGSGSIMVGAAQRGLTSVGIEINPLAEFVARVKLTPLSRRDLARAGLFATSMTKALPGWEPHPVPSLRIARKVFEPTILRTLLKLRTGIETWDVGEEGRRFLRLAWLSILEDVGSYFKEGNGIKYRDRKRIGNHYEKRPDGLWQRERFGPDQEAFVIRKLKNQLDAMFQDAPLWRQGTWHQQETILGSALDITAHLSHRKFDSIVFSPPYANRFDYFESMKVELWFGGFVSSYEEALALRKASLRSHLAADLTRPVENLQPLEELMALMDRNSSSWRMGVPALLRGYFHDMREVLKQCRDLLHDGGRCNIVVGNSAYAGVIVPTDTLLAMIGLDSGFGTAKVNVVRHLTVSPQQRSELSGMQDLMRESVVVLE